MAVYFELNEFQVNFKFFILVILCFSQVHCGGFAIFFLLNIVDVFYTIDSTVDIVFP